MTLCASSLLLVLLWAKEGTASAFISSNYHLPVWHSTHCARPTPRTLDAASSGSSSSFLDATALRAVQKATELPPQKAKATCRSRKTRLGAGVRISQAQVGAPPATAAELQEELRRLSADTANGVSADEERRLRIEQAAKVSCA